MTKTYKIVRHFKDYPEDNQIVRTGLTLAEAQRHCRDKETSSSTCTSTWARSITETYGPWFDGYSEERQVKNNE